MAILLADDPKKLGRVSIASFEDAASDSRTQAKALRVAWNPFDSFARSEERKRSSQD